MLGSPSPTRNCHSGPSGWARVLLVSIIGTIPPKALPAPYGPPMGYRGGGGRTLSWPSAGRLRSDPATGSMARRAWEAGRGIQHGDGLLASLREAVLSFG